MQSRTRAAMHAGSWYVGDRVKLNEELEEYLQRAKNYNKFKAIKGIIGPHAGYYYSGPTAAWAYKYLQPTENLKVFLLGPSHHIYLQGCGITSMDRWATPLGDITVDRYITEKLKQTGKFRYIDQDDEEYEHSLEMHLPYLRKMLGDKFKLVPIMVGATDLKMQNDYADILLPFFYDKDTLFVISSDFCHWGSRFEYQYHNKEDGLPWQSIYKLDGMGMNHIQDHDPAAFDKYIKETKNTICGRHPIGIYLHLLKKSKLGLKTKFVKYAQSEQVKTSKQSSVSYASAISFVPL